ncbi:hypothetical protein DFJ74DRAFT_694186 [Hyaloraphidium curvatum]|nr:hypothetical protein DFJ74DRAFT_694186 [Hyaloraphidium curvatum]
MPGDVGAHLARMNLLNQCAAMAVQLNRDVLGLRNHKYLAHQVALLYQSLSQLAALLPSSPLFSDLQSRIRERFDAVKQQCSAAPPSGSTDPEEAEGPVLSPDLVEWLAGLTRDVVAQVVFGRHGGARLPLEGDGMYDALWS